MASYKEIIDRIDKETKQNTQNQESYHKENEENLKALEERLTIKINQLQEQIEGLRKDNIKLKSMLFQNLLLSP